MAGSAAPQQRKSNRKGTSAKRSTPGADFKLYDAAARSRVNERRRRQMMQRMRHFESLLPGVPVVGRVNLPRMSLRPLWSILSSRMLWISLALVLLVAGLASWVSLDERWYIYQEDMHFNGLSYLSAEELWEASDIDGWQVFWVDGDELRRRLLENPYVADAEVRIAPLASKITANVTEVRPVALWETDDGMRWLRNDGMALEPRGATPPGLLQILDPPADATLAGAARGAAIDPAVLRSAQALANRLPGVTPLRYNALVGLNFRLPDTAYWVYWGDGEDVERKLDNLAAARTLLNEGSVEGSVIDVRFERPYIK